MKTNGKSQCVDSDIIATVKPAFIVRPEQPERLQFQENTR